MCFYSKKFDNHQNNYFTIGKETLVLLLALQQFDQCSGTTIFPVVVFTDHNPLIFIDKMKNKNQRLIKWSLSLYELNLEIRHIKGKDNVIADALSRSESLGDYPRSLLGSITKGNLFIFIFFSSPGT